MGIGVGRTAAVGAGVPVGGTGVPVGGTGVPVGGSGEPTAVADTDAVGIPADAVGSGAAGVAVGCRSVGVGRGVVGDSGVSCFPIGIGDGSGGAVLHPMHATNNPTTQMMFPMMVMNRIASSTASHTCVLCAVSYHNTVCGICFNPLAGILVF